MLAIADAGCRTGGAWGCAIGAACVGMAASLLLAYRHCHDGLNDIVELVRHSEKKICTAASCGSERRG